MPTSHDEAAARAAVWEPPDDHITTQLGTWISYDERGAIAHTTLREDMWGAGSTRPRLGVFASVADALGGQTPEPSRFPTIDLRTHLLTDPPSTGPIELIGRPLRIGRSFVVVESIMCDADAKVFGRSTVTLINNLSAGHSPTAPFEPTVRESSFDQMLGARIVDERSLEFDLTDRLVNGGMDTPFGGAQALFAELAAEHLAGEPLAAFDIDIRFLKPMKVGPIRAAATRIGPDGAPNTYRVDLVDVGADHVMAAVTILARPLVARR